MAKGEANGKCREDVEQGWSRFRAAVARANTIGRLGDSHCGFGHLRERDARDRRRVLDDAISMAFVERYVSFHDRVRC